MSKKKICSKCGRDLCYDPATKKWYCAVCDT